MKILLVNKFWYRRGGDCIYTINLARLLREHGHEVAEYAMSYPENIESEWSSYFAPKVEFSGLRGKLATFSRCLGLPGEGKSFARLLDDFKPDVVHLGNIHTQLSPVIAKMAHDRGIKVIWTLHDYKLLCPRYDCLKKGTIICEDCFSGGKLPVLRNKCMKDSLAASFLALAEALRWNRELLQSSTDCFICPSKFMLSKMESGGFDSSKLVHLCNFIGTEACARDSYGNRGDYYCYVGRLSPEKGLETLVKAALRLPYKLMVVGDGPLAGLLPDAPNITYVGKKDWQEIKEIVGNARFTVIPSEWYENNPLSVLESLCLGTPVLGANIGGIPELIGKENGMCFQSGSADDLERAISEMCHREFDYESIARASLEAFNANRYYENLMRLYSAPIPV